MQVQGRLTTGDVNGSYILRIKNFDLQGGLAAAMNQGELVSSVDINTVANHVGVNDALSYWCDFDGNGSVGSTDVNMINAHATHDCDSPNNP